MPSAKSSTEKRPRQKKKTLSDIGVDFSRKGDIQGFIQDNISRINNYIGSFDNKACKKAKLKFDATDIKSELHEKFVKALQEDPSLKDKIWEEFEKHNFVKSKIKEIAISLGFYFKDVEELLEKDVFVQLSGEDTQKLAEAFVSQILNAKEFSEEKINYYSSVIMPIVEKSLYLALKNGFSTNLNDMESGLMTANAGDSAQFLFLARAILAGYNCSNVDVRSSRYDAVIDKGGKLFRVQIKGISGNTVSIKDRDRGGRGIDSTNQHNKGKRITSKDCEIYVAVDRQTGICYIIPTTHIDTWTKDQKNVKDLAEYKENWKAIDELGK